MKKLIIQSSCHFILAGLGGLLDSEPFIGRAKVVEKATNMMQYKELLKVINDVDMIILTLGSTESNFIPVLNIITHILPIVTTYNKLVLVGDFRKMELMRNYFEGLRHIHRVLDVSMPLEHLREQLLEVLFESNYSTLSKAERIVKLSPREMRVLHCILNGENMVKIADKLQLNYKTVSHHKRSALSKLGMRSLSQLYISA
ncbi:helix-turn-helix transcriptional regulator [Chania multitudinisentens]|uniref:helix-turn-helix transcriptional regulator n=1 Tax=Chania multitudinisentens TaxID=1639108 RepID=UPI0003E15456|nr:LuxR C-terminal-related transcriptional regulator [Chania multitudinisentens]